MKLNLKEENKVEKEGANLSKCTCRPCLYLDSNQINYRAVRGI